MQIKPSLSTGKQLFALVILLTLVGILIVFEASVAEAYAKFGDKYFFIKQQVKWLGLGFAALLVNSLIPTIVWKKLGPLIFVGGVLALIAVLIPGLGVEVKGATRWLELGGFRFQPVEIMKFGIVSYFASWLSQHQRLSPFLTFTLIPTVLVMMQPDLGSTLVLLSICFGMYVAAGGNLKSIILLGTIGIVGVSLLIASSPYRRDRIKTYLDPSSDPLGAGYQMRQITIALGNGGVFGKGIGQSRQKYQYIPEVSTDSIFAIVAEETGFVGSTALIVLFAVFIHSCFRIVRTIPEGYEHLLATGIALWISAHILINLAAVVALVPLTGIPLPFISRGGTSLVTLMSSVGILISLSRADGTPQKKRDKSRNNLHL